MDIYIVNDNFSKIGIIDDYYNLVWTERYDSVGDFVLETPNTPWHVNNIKLGRFLSIPESKRLMYVTSCEETKDKLAFTGESIESVLKNRIVKPDQICIGTVDKVVSFVTYPLFVGHYTGPSWTNGNDTIEGFRYSENLKTNESIVYQTKAMSVYDTIRDLINYYGFGFKIETSLGGIMRLRLYEGVRRTGIVLSEDYDTLENGRVIRTLNGSANLFCYKTHDGNFGIIGKRRAFPGENNVQIPRQFHRFMVYKDMSSVKPEDFDSSDDYRQSIRGEADIELSKYSYKRTLDGQIPKDSPYKYGTHYDLGDIVKVKVNGYTYDARISEYIWSCSPTESVEYPTLSYI